MGYRRKGGRIWLTQLTYSAKPIQGAEEDSRQLFWDGTILKARPQRWAVEVRGQRESLYPRNLFRNGT